MTHDYKRNDTTALFAALNLLDGKVIGECYSRHRHQEWLKFLRYLDGEFLPRATTALVVNNYGTHKELHVQAWLVEYLRFVCHFVLTSSSWLNLMERWFGELTKKAIRCGSLSVPDLKKAIEEFMHTWNQKSQALHYSLVHLPESVHSFVAYDSNERCDEFRDDESAILMRPQLPST